MLIDWEELCRENPDLELRTEQTLGEGWVSRSFLVDDTLVFRFPKRADAWPEYDREIKFLDFAGDSLPLEVPHYLRTRRESAGSPHGYAVYRYLPGELLDPASLSPHRRTEAATALASFLRSLHRLDPPAELAGMIPSEDLLAYAGSARDADEREVIPYLSHEETRALHQQFSWFIEDSDNHSDRKVVVHADLSGDHLLVRNQRLCGVLDFGDVAWCDPDYDFTYIYEDFGAEFTVEVASAYGHPNPEGLLLKAHYFALADEIDAVVNGPWAGARGIDRYRVGPVAAPAADRSDSITGMAALRPLQ